MELGMLDRYVGCIIGGAAGDALGYPVEFMGEHEIHARFGEAGIGTLAQAAELDGSSVAYFSDDTQMTLFTAAGLLAPVARAGAAGGQAVPSVKHVWDAYRDWLGTQGMLPLRERAAHRQRSWLASVDGLQHRRAPGNTCISSLRSHKQGSPKRPANDSCGCGGVMRVAPVPLFCAARIADAVEAESAASDLAARAAALTHGHPMGWIPAALMARIVYRCLAVEPSSDAATRFEQLDAIVAAATAAIAEEYQGVAHVVSFVETVGEVRTLARKAALSSETMDDLSALHTFGEGWVGDEALNIALYAVLAHVDDLGAAIRCAVNHRGDSDSTGAIAGNLLGAFLGIDAVRASFDLASLEQVPLLEEIATELYHASDPSALTTDGRPWGERYATSSTAV